MKMYKIQWGQTTLLGSNSWTGRINKMVAFKIEIVGPHKKYRLHCPLFASFDVKRKQTAFNTISEAEREATIIYKTVLDQLTISK